MNDKDQTPRGCRLRAMASGARRPIAAAALAVLLGVGASAAFPPPPETGTTAAAWTTSASTDLPDARSDAFAMTAVDDSLGYLHGMNLPAARLTSAAERNAGYVRLLRYYTFATWRTSTSAEPDPPETASAVDHAQQTLLTDLALSFRLRLPGVGCRDTTTLPTEEAYYSTPTTLSQLWTRVDLGSPDPARPLLRIDPNTMRLLCVEPLPHVTGSDLSVLANYSQP